MSDRHAKMEAVAQRIWDATASRASEPDDALEVCDLLLVQLEARLRRWIGAEGYASLLARSTADTISGHPILARIPNLLADESELAVGAEAEGEAARVAIMALLVTMMRQLGGIIGDGMAIRLIEQSVTANPHGGAATEHKDLPS